MQHHLLVFSFCNDWVDMFANEYDLVRRHLDDQGEVVVYGCTGGLPACRAKMASTNKHTCSICNYRREQAYASLMHLPNFSYVEMPEVNVVADFPTTYSELIGYEYNEYRFGLCALSSTQVFYSTCDQSLHLPSTTLDFLHTAVLAYHKVWNVLTSSTLSGQALVYNGRLAEEYGALAAVRQLGMQYAVHEVTGIDEKYKVVENSLLHDLDYWHRIVFDYIDLVGRSTEAYESGCTFFENKRKGIRTNDTVYIGADFEEFEVPENFRNRKLVGLFNSSDHECRYTEFDFQYSSNIGPSQYEVFRRLVEFYANNEEICFVMRIHPNALKGPVSDLQLLLSLRRHNLLIIAPDDKTSSYSVIDCCDVVVSAGSTIGVEATYWGKPSISLVPTYYTALDSVYFPQTFDELCALVSSALRPKHKVSAVAYGAFVQIHGQERKHVLGSIPEYRFDGVPLARYSPSVYEAVLYSILRNWGCSTNFARNVSMPLRVLSSIKHGLFRR
jgi:hypothetical protein